MSVTIFLAICVLGLDFMIYALFQWTYGDKRRALARKIAAHRNALQTPSLRRFPVAGSKPAFGHESHWHGRTSSQAT